MNYDLKYIECRKGTHVKRFATYKEVSDFLSATTHEIKTAMKDKSLLRGYRIYAVYRDSCHECGKPINRMDELCADCYLDGLVDKKLNPSLDSYYQNDPTPRVRSI